MTRTADRADWHAAVGSDLVVAVEPAERWTLVACTDAREDAGWCTWTLTFRAPEGRQQGTYPVDLPTVGTQSVFVVPTALADGATTLTATFVVAADPTPGGTA